MIPRIKIQSGHPADDRVGYENMQVLTASYADLLGFEKQVATQHWKRWFISNDPKDRQYYGVFYRRKIK